MVYVIGMGVVLLYSTLALCAVLCVVLIRRYDLHDREPWWAVIVAIVLGAAGMTLAGRIEVWMMSQGGLWAARHFNTNMAISAGTVEELCKVLAVLAIALIFRRVFNDPLDGLIFGALVGLGAAMEESVVYLAKGAKAGMLPGTEPVRLMGHLVMGGISAFGLGTLASNIRQRDRIAWWWAPIGMAAGIALHVGWDIVAFDAGSLGAMLVWHNVASIAMMLGGFVLFGTFARIGDRRSARVFAVAGSPVSPA